MARGSRNNRRRSKNKKQAKRQRDDFNFSFNDEWLQQSYIDDWNFYNNSIGGKQGLPKPKMVNKQMADALVNGRLGDDLEDLEYIYSRTSDLWYQQASKHKYDLFNDQRDFASNETSLRKYVDKMNVLIKSLNYYSDGDIIGKDKVAYNIMWYERYGRSK